MKLLLISFILFSWLTSGAQIPVIRTNVPLEEKQSIIYSQYFGEYDFLIASTSECYWWADKVNYQILAFSNDKWERISFFARKKKNGKLSKPVISHRPFESKIAETLIYDLTNNSFWNLNNDSLNLSTRKNPDSSITKYSLSDGVNYKFEVLTKNEFRIIESYEPEYFLEKMPEIKDREKFIKAKEIIESALKNNGT